MRANTLSTRTLGTKYLLRYLPWVPYLRDFPYLIKSCVLIEDTRYLRYG